MASTTAYDLYRKHLKVVPVADASVNKIAQSQHMTANTALTLNGSLVSGGVYTAGDGVNVKVGHQVNIKSGADLHLINFTVVGTDPDGLALSETIAGPNINTVTTTNYFYTVTSITPDTTDGVNNVQAGIGGTLATQRVPIENKASSFTAGLGCTITGTISVTAQLTMDDIFDSSVTPAYIADTTFATKTATFYSALGVLVTAVRFVTNSYSSGATVTFHVIQNKALS